MIKAILKFRNDYANWIEKLNLKIKL